MADRRRSRITGIPVIRLLEYQRRTCAPSGRFCAWGMRCSGSVVASCTGFLCGLRGMVQIRTIDGADSGNRFVEGRRATVPTRLILLNSSKTDARLQCRSVCNQLIWFNCGKTPHCLAYAAGSRLKRDPSNLKDRPVNFYRAGPVPDFKSRGVWFSRI